jgi:hypothetical protein
LDFNQGLGSLGAVLPPRDLARLLGDDPVA